MTADVENRLIAAAVATCRAEAVVRAADPCAEPVPPIGVLVCGLGNGHDGLHRDPVDGVWWTRDPMAAGHAA